MADQFGDRKPVDRGIIIGNGKMGGETVALSQDSLQAIREAAARHGVESVRLFGSRISGVARPDSDLDLLVRLAPGRGWSDFFAFCEAVETAVGGRVDVIPEDGLSPFLRERILAEAVPL